MQQVDAIDEVELSGCLQFTCKYAALLQTSRVVYTKETQSVRLSALAGVGHILQHLSCNLQIFHKLKKNHGRWATGLLGGCCVECRVE